MKRCKEAGGGKAMQDAWRQEHYRAAGINDKLIIRLRDLSHIMRSLYEGRGSQKRILIVLGEMDAPVTQRELTRRLGIQPGSASEVISKLEEADYIRRSPSETDRRTVRIELTGAGRQQAAEARQQRMRRHEEMFSILTPGEKEQLLSLLEKLGNDWESRYPAGKKEPPHHHREQAGRRPSHGPHNRFPGEGRE